MRFKLFRYSLLSAICALSLAACGCGGGGHKGGSDNSGEDPTVEDDTQTSQINYLLPEGVTSARFTIKGGNNITINLTLTDVHAEGTVWTAKMSGTVTMPTDEMFFESDKAAVEQFNILECTIQRSSNSGIILSTDGGSRPLTDSEVALELNNINVSLNSTPGDNMRNGIITDGKFMLYYYSGNLWGQDSIDITNLLQPATVTLDKFTKE